MTRAERAELLADELGLRWLHRIPVEEQPAFLASVRWSVRSASLEPEEHLVADGAIERA